jgi:polysaccharide biosynthesis/export protein
MKTLRFCHALAWSFAFWVGCAGIVLAEDSTTLVQADPDYKIAPLDIINVDVFLEKDLSKDFKVQANGKITFPLLSDVDVAGKTTAEVETQLKEALGKDYLVDPQVTVVVRQYRQRTVNVLGEVNKPGPIELSGEKKYTIVDALAAAGGLTKGAATSKIDLTRGGKTKRYKLEDLKKITDSSKVIYLEMGDTITVRETIF